MSDGISIQIDEITKEKYKKMILNGQAREVEDEIGRLTSQNKALLFGKLLNEVTTGEEVMPLVKKFRDTYQYRIIRKKKVQVTVKGGEKIIVDSWYGLAKEKKKGRPKKGRNGTGTHILLSYWGFKDKCSPGYINQVVRCATASSSSELASEQLNSEGIKLSGKGVGQLMLRIGTIAVKHRDALLLKPGETLSGKRIIISLDGGRVRCRETKPGRHALTQKRAGYTTQWKEPKLLVISEIDETGKKRKKSTPIYEATMGGPEEVLSLLVNLCEHLGLSRAKEVVFISDGALWIWNLFKKLADKFKLQNSTEIIDFYHASEHITEITELHTKKVPVQQRQWASKLKDLLRTGKFESFTKDILAEANKENFPKMKEKLVYFQKNEHRMQYDAFEEKHLPIGSGIVESAVRRVINLKLKSPGIFWKIENVEKMLHLRCILMAGRWNTFMDNFFQAISLSYA